jgi:hypothetical protein
MTRRPVAAVALVAVLVLSGCTVGYQPSVPERSDPPSEDHLGYYNGYWYDDTFEFDTEDGLNDGETEAVVSRAMARVQLLRGLRFEEDIEVELITREAFNEEFDDVWRDPPEGRQALDNAQHEALFLVGPDEDVVDVRRRNQGGTVLGFYQPSQERLVVVSANQPATLDDELTLAHELVHALQDQRFGLRAPADTTADAVNARNGLVEGDATVVERAYERRCESGVWQCVESGTDSGGTLPSEFNWGVYFFGFFPYAEGPGFVEHHRGGGNWSAVDAMHGEYPVTSAEIIAPETYGSDDYGEATVHDRTRAGWERVTVENGSDAATVGRAGLASMFAYTAYAGDGEGVIARDEFRNAGSSGLDPDSPYTYDVPYTEGWYGDRLHAYERDGETAHVWNVTFDDAGDAATFRRGYGQVIEHWGGQRRASAAGGTAWTFDDRGRFDGAVRVQRDGNSVTVVKAPSRAALNSVYAPAEAPSAGVESRSGAVAD